MTETETLPSLLAMLHDFPSGCAISLASVSKIPPPGQRLGWVSAGAHIIRRFVDSGVAGRGGGLSHFAATLAHAMLKSGSLKDNFDTLQRVYGQRRDDVADLLRVEFADTVQFNPTHGGYFYWLTFTDGIKTDVLLTTARESGVSYRSCAAFSASGGFTHALRNSISLYETDDLAEGLRRLSTAFRSHAKRR